MWILAGGRGVASDAWEWEQKVQRPSDASMPGMAVDQQERSMTKVQDGPKEETEGQIKRSCRLILWLKWRAT